MDPNQPTQPMSPQPVVPNPVAPTPTTFSAVPTSGDSSSKKSPKMIIIVIVSLALLAFLGVAGYMYFIKGKTPAANQSVLNNSNGINLEDIRSEIQGIGDENIEEDFKSVDSEVEKL